MEGGAAADTAEERGGGARTTTAAGAAETAQTSPAVWCERGERGARRAGHVHGGCTRGARAKVRCPPARTADGAQAHGAAHACPCACADGRVHRAQRLCAAARRHQSAPQTAQARVGRHRAHLPEHFLQVEFRRALFRFLWLLGVGVWALGLLLLLQG